MLLGALVVLSDSDGDGSTEREPDVPARAAPGRSPVRSPADEQARDVEHIEAPVFIGVTVDGLEARLDWTWTHTRAWDQVALKVYLGSRDPDTGRITSEDLVTEERLRAAATRAAGVLRGTLSHQVPRAGLYSFRLEVVATDQPVTHAARGVGHDATWRAWKREKVMVGAEGWSIVPLPGLRGDLLHSANDPRFAFFFELYHGPNLVRDCGLTYQVRWPAPTQGHDCDWETGERFLALDNPTPGTPGAWRLGFHWYDHDRPFARLDLASDHWDHRAAHGDMAGNTDPAGW